VGWGELVGLGVGVGWFVFALAVSGTDLYVGGIFTTAGNIAKWDGANWSALGTGVSGPPYVRTVSALAVLGTHLYVGGTFTSAGGSAVNNIAQWDGTGWSALGSGMNGPVLALAVLGTNLYVGGGFTMAGGKPATFIAKADITTFTITRTSTNAVMVWWPSALAGSLQQNIDLNTTNWTAPSENVTSNDSINYIIVNPPSGNRFYRLFKP